MARKTNTNAVKSSEPRLREEVRQLANNEALLRERLAELELALEDEGWQRMVFGGDREFSREGLRKIMRLSRLMFLKNPLINRAVTLQSIYVWGQGCTITSTDEATQEVILSFLQDHRNQCELTSHQARTMKEQDLQVLGNLFFAFFTSLVDGQTVVRTIPADEIDDIIANPEDKREPWYYKRTWAVSSLDPVTGTVNSKQETAYYPDFRYEPTDGRRATIGGKPVMWDAPVYHVRVGGLSDMAWGVPETYQAQDWARAYNVFLENWSKIVQAYARFAFQVTTKGGRPGVAAAKARLGTTLGSTAETNPPPQTGSFFVAGEGTDLQPVKTAGATTKADDARRLLLMICAAFGMPESFFGDVSVGNLATAKSLDRPTELKFRDRQELWKSIMITILKYVVGRSKTAANGRLRLVGTTDETPIDVSFPPILEHDVAQQMAAITAGATLNGSPKADTIDDDTLSRLILTALGVPNSDEALAAIQKQRTANQARKDAIAKQISGAPAKPVKAEDDEEQAA